MLKYEYEEIVYESKGFGFTGGIKLENRDFKSIIDERAGDGWEYAGFIPTVQTGAGYIEKISLIFKKDE